jgi:SulP family sulfate permease
MPIDPPPTARAWPVFSTLRGLTAGDIGRDLVAGLTLAAIAVPEQMATARLGGFAPELGFIAFIAASVGFALFGANRTLSAGADSTITPIFAGSLALLAVTGSPEYAALAAALALMVGLLLVVAGALKLGWVANLLSVPVITGFLAGIALHIVLSQAPTLLGLPDGSGDVYRRLTALAGEMGRVSPLSLAIGLGVFIVALGSDKLSGRIPGALIGLVSATVATAVLSLDRQGVAVLGRIGGAVPHPRLPHIGLETAIPLVGLAFVIALVVMMQTAVTTRSFGVTDRDGDINRNFVGIGVGGALAGLFGAFPVNASPPRTAIAAQAGARSQLTSLIAALLVAALLIGGGDLLAHIPAAALGGVLLFVAVRIFRVRALAELMRRTPAEFALALLTMVAIVALPIETGVAIGVFLSLVHGVFTITRAAPIVFERAPGSTVWWPVVGQRRGESEPGVLVMGFQAPLSFLNAYEFRRGVLRAIRHAEPGLRLFVLEASSIVEIDFTASTILAEVIDKARAAGVDFALARLESVRAQAAFDRFGLTDRLGQDHMFHSVDQALRALSPASAGSVQPAGSR